MAIGQGPALVRQQAPRLVGRVQRSSVWDRALGRRPAAAISVRPAASAPIPTRERARPVVYRPHLNGKAEAGEIVWTWVPSGQAGQGRDRPVLLIGRERSTLFGLLLSADQSRGSDQDWIEIGTGPWDHRGRTGYVRMDRVLDVPEAGIRREGAILARKVFDRVAHRLCNEYLWR
jgi:hypothetical protein